MKHIDAAVIGCGTAGTALALALADAGIKVCLVEQSDRMYGGACPNTACIPTKMLVHAANLSAGIGGSIADCERRYTVAIDEKDQAIRLSRVNLFHKLSSRPNITIVNGIASFVGSSRLAISSSAGTEEVEADAVFIATGSSPTIPTIPGIDNKLVYTSDQLINVHVLPERLVIIGGGYVGMEFASLYHNFGSGVTILQDEAPLLPHEDPDIAQAVLTSFDDRGIKILKNAHITRIEDAVEEALVVVEHQDKTLRIPAEAILVATGRHPNLENLNIEATGINLAEHGGIDTDEHLRSTIPHVWALGDARGKHQFTYIAYDDYRIVFSDMISDGSRTTRSRGAIPYTVFTDPPFSRVGLTEEEAREAGFVVKTARLNGDEIACARIGKKPVGLMKAVVDASTGKILGLHLFCLESPELVNLAKIAIDADLPYTTLRDAVFTHPTMAEAMNSLFARIG